jgi:CRP-like cAMP-binding protein
MVEFANSLTVSAPAFPERPKSRHFDIPKNPLFTSLSRQQIRLVLPHIKHRKIRQGRTLLEEGAKNPGKIFIILQGQIAIAKEGFSPVEKVPMTYEIGTLQHGDIFGEVSFVDGKPGAVTFLAKSDVQLAVVDLSAAHRKMRARRVRDIVVEKLRRHIATQAHESVTLRVNSLQLETELAAYRSGVGHIVITTLCLLSVYTLMLSFLPRFKSVAHANFALSPLIILLFALSFVPIVATSGFPARFFGLHLDNWRRALFLSLRASAVFMAVFVLAKWVLIKTSPVLAGLELVDGAEVVVDGHPVSVSHWYWLAFAVYMILTPMQEFVARSGIQAPLYAFLHGSETKRRWCAIMVSNLVFAAAHAHISLAFAMAAFLPGILWGWIFAKTNSLFAASVSHLIVGGLSIFVFGIEGIVARLA